MSYLPCTNCNERHLNCHSECEKYKSFRSALDNRNKAMREKLEFYRYVIDHTTELAKKQRFK